MATLSLDSTAKITYVKEPVRDAIADTAAIENTVKRIIEAVRLRGDAALMEFSKTFDKVDVVAQEVSEAERKEAVAGLEPETREDWVFR